MTALTAVYVDFQCQYSDRVWRWLSSLPERATVDVRPYSLSSGPGEGQRGGPWEHPTPSWGLELLALGELAREAGHEAHLAFVEEAFATVHGRRGDASSPEEWLALGARVGLDLDRFTSDAERWRAEVGLWHREAEDDLGVFGVPSLVFDEEHALFVRLDSDVEPEPGARRLLNDLADLAFQPVDEVRRTA